MQNQRPAERGCGLAPATRQLLDTADPAEPGRRDSQVERAIQSFLAQPDRSTGELDDALSDQLLILAHHFGVEESYFFDRVVAEKVTARRKRRDWSRPEQPVPDDKPRISTVGGEPGGAEPHKSRVLVGVAAAVAVLAAGAAGGAVGYKMGIGAGQASALAAGQGQGPAQADHHGVASDSLDQVAKRARAGVVQIRAHAGTVPGTIGVPAAHRPAGAAPANGVSTGAGIVLSADGLLLTNNHVVAAAFPAGEVTVQFENGVSRPAHIVGRDAAADLAVVAADNVAGLTPIKLGNSDSVRVGEHVVSIGSPFGPGGSESSSVTSIVSAVNHAVVLGHDEATRAPQILNAIQTDATVGPTDSGGPLLDARGFVIGIGTALPAAGPSAVPAAAGPGAAAPGTPAKLGYAIPINLAERVAEHLIDTGRGIQPVLGVRLMLSTRPVPNEPTGAKLAAVAPGSPAANAGLKAGDLVVKVNGHPVISGDEFIHMTRALAPGDTVTLMMGNGLASHVVLARRPVAASK